MDLTRIDHVGVVVDGGGTARLLERLGLRIHRVIDAAESRACFYAAGDTSLELIEVHDPQSRRERLGGATAARLEHVAFAVEDLAEARRTLRSRGVEVSWPPYRSGDAWMIWTSPQTSGGVIYQFVRRDPE